MEKPRRRRRDVLEDPYASMDHAFLVRRQREEQEEREKDPHWQLHYEESFHSYEDEPDRGPIRGSTNWKLLKKDVERFVHPDIYKELVRCGRRVRPSLQNCPAQGDAAEMYVLVTLWRDMHGVPYASIPSQVDGGFPIDRATFRTNIHLLRKAFAEWGRTEIVVGTKKDWEASAKWRSLPDGVKPAAYLIMDVRDFPMAIRDGSNDLFFSIEARSQRREEFEHDNPHRKNVEWLHKGWGPGVRWLIVFDLNHTIRFIDGPFSPLQSPAEHVSAMAARIDELFPGATFITDAEFYGVQGLQKCTIDAPMPRKKSTRARSELIESESDEDDDEDDEELERKKTKKKTATKKKATTKKPAAAQHAPKGKLPGRSRHLMFFRDVGRLYSWLCVHQCMQGSCSPPRVQGKVLEGAGQGGRHPSGRRRGAAGLSSVVLPWHLECSTANEDLVIKLHMGKK